MNGRIGPIQDVTARWWAFDAPPRRVVSLVPSLTDTLIRMGCGDRLVGRTRYCISPAGVVEAIPTVGGTKDPDVDRIRALAPELVFMDGEENRRADAETLLAAGVPVFTVLPRTLDDAADVLATLATLWPDSDAVRERATALAEGRRRLARRPVPPLPVYCPIWRNPAMSFNGQTYISAMLAATGFANVLADRPERYFRLDPGGELPAGVAAVLLPTEPYPFDADDARRIAADLALPPERVRLVPGEWLTWYGWMTVEALERLPVIRRELAVDGE